VSTQRERTASSFSKRSVAQSQTTLHVLAPTWGSHAQRGVFRPWAKQALKSKYDAEPFLPTWEGFFYLIHARDFAAGKIQRDAMLPTTLVVKFLCPCAGTSAPVIL
jgi:hypothetical protein